MDLVIELNHGSTCFYVIDANTSCDMILPRTRYGFMDQTTQNTKFNMEITTELLLARRELIAQEVGTRITDERTRPSERVRKPPDWTKDFHL